MTGRRVPLAERFWAKVNKTDSCWLWMGGKSEGYGMIRTDAPERKMTGAHRISYEMAHGPIPRGKVVDHRCHNRACVNPEHLRAVTSKQNSENVAGPSRLNKSGAPRGLRILPWPLARQGQAPRTSPLHSRIQQSRTSRSSSQSSAAFLIHAQRFGPQGDPSMNPTITPDIGPTPEQGPLP